MLSPSQLKFIQLIREVKILPAEVERAVELLLEGGELEPEHFSALVSALLRAPNLDGSEQIVGGIVHR